MALPTSYTQSYSVLGDFFGKIRDAQAPETFTHQILKDLGYKSNNHRPFIPLMKSLGFLSSDGSPTKRYHDYRNHALSKSIMGEALKEAYSDIYLIKSHPSSSDKDLIKGKFKSFHNSSDNVAGLMTKTFYALLDLAELNFDGTTPKTKSKKIEEIKKKEIIELPKKDFSTTLGLHYNIQIHLPATKDVEVYNAFFKSLKDYYVE
ncbi:MAG: DUF5343 domain-containing protein [Calditrichales bacterium]|nr:DUF5343 domain-containing protein [Calditrichales bacterium]